MQPKIQFQCATTKTTIILSLDMLQWAMFNVHFLQDVRDADLGHIQTTAHKTSGFSNYSVGLMLRKGKTGYLTEDDNGEHKHMSAV